MKADGEIYLFGTAWNRLTNLVGQLPVSYLKSPHRLKECWSKRSIMAIHCVKGNLSRTDFYFHVFLTLYETFPRGCLIHRENTWLPVLFYYKSSQKVNLAKNIKLVSQPTSHIFYSHMSSENVFFLTGQKHNAFVSHVSHNVSHVSHVSHNALLSHVF